MEKPRIKSWLLLLLISAPYILKWESNEILLISFRHDIALTYIKKAVVIMDDAY